MTYVAIIGLAASYGAGRNLETYAHAVCFGRPISTAVSSESEGAALAQHVSQAALADARLSQDWHVITIAISSPMTDTFPLPDSAFSSPERRSAGEALVEAQRLLASRQANAVVLAAVDKSGAGAVVLARTDDMPPDRIYAVLEGISMGKEPAAVCQQAWREAHLTSATIGYLETSDLPSVAELDAYRTSGASETCALSSGTESALAALIKAALCLHCRTLPPWPGWERPVDLVQWRDTPFYVAPQARPWFAPREGKRRAAARIAEGGKVTYLVLAEPAPGRMAPAVYPQPGETAFHLFPIAAEGREGLLSQLTAMQARLAEGISPKALAAEAFAAYQRHAAAPYALGLAGHDSAELQREVKFALEGVPQAFEAGRSWASPRGSYFTARARSTFMWAWAAIYSNTFLVCMTAWPRWFRMSAAA
jgi:acyl transferase domain-containing protein